MDALSIARRFIEAWNRHDRAAVVASFLHDGTYRDPATGGVLVGDAIGWHSAALFTAFPDLAFEIVTGAPTGDRTAAIQWVLCGTNTGSFLGFPPTGGSIALRGADFATTDGMRLRTVERYYDHKDLALQVGLQAIMQPHAIGPLAFGTCVAMRAGNGGVPGALSITRIGARSNAENAEIEQRAATILEDLAETPGFLGTVLTTIGLGGHTITAWESPDAPWRMLENDAHKDAVARFLGVDFASGGMTSVWVPLRRHAWRRCERCGLMTHLAHAGPGLPDNCRCGASLSDEAFFF